LRAPPMVALRAFDRCGARFAFWLLAVFGCLAATA
jgi:hypothetical protein